MKISLCQIDVRAGDISHNLATMLKSIDTARKNGADIAVFPEMSLTGYLIGDTWNNPDFITEALSADGTLLGASHGIVIVYGTVIIDWSKKNKDGRTRKYNGVKVIQDGNLLGTGIKSLMPNYRFFDDSRYFYSLLDLALEEGKNLAEYLNPLHVTIAGQELRLGLEVCEDLWFGDYLAGGRPINVSEVLIEKGANLIINCSASPWTFNKNAARHRRVRDALRENKSGCIFVYVNCVGVQNNGKNFVTFDGRSTVYDPSGTIKSWIATPYEAADYFVDLDEIMGGEAIYPEAENRAESQYRAIIRAIQGLDDILGNSSWPAIIGLSGGVDSAVSACLLEQALGKERVKAFNLPTHFNSEKTKTIAANIAQELGISYEVIPIEDLVTCNEKILERFGPKELHRENIQAKIRGTSILSNLAGILGGIMVNNGNKVELALGYATLYGDVNGALAPLGDLSKTDVFNLARYLNHHIYRRELIPEILLPNESFIFALPPSAELKPDQVDPMKWGYHDAILAKVCDYKPMGMVDLGKLYRDGQLWQELGLDLDLVIRYELHKPEVFIKDLEWFFKLLSQGVFKRIQAPPVVVTTRAAFGYDYRESQLPYRPGLAWKRLCEELLRGGA